MFILYAWTASLSCCRISAGGESACRGAEAKGRRTTTTHPHPVGPARAPSEAIELQTTASATRVAFFTLFITFLGEIRHARGERENRAGELAMDHVGAQRRANGRTYFSSKTACPEWREGKSMRRRGYGRATRDGKFERTCAYQQPPLPAVETDLWMSSEFLCWYGRVEDDGGE